MNYISFPSFLNIYHHMYWNHYQHAEPHSALDPYLDWCRRHWVRETHVADNDVCCSVHHVITVRLHRGRSSYTVNQSFLTTSNHCGRLAVMVTSAMVTVVLEFVYRCFWWIYFLVLCLAFCFIQWATNMSQVALFALSDHVFDNGIREIFLKLLCHCVKDIFLTSKKHVKKNQLEKREKCFKIQRKTVHEQS